MKQDFMELRSKGYSIPQMARLYQISFQTIYNHLDDIAIENSVSRDDLLQRPRNKKKLPND